MVQTHPTHPTHPKPLKRLAPVGTLLGLAQSFAQTGVNLSLYSYSQAKRFVPASVQPSLQQAEEAVFANVTPLVARGQDLVQELLRLADDEVDVLVGNLNNRLSEVQAKAKANATDASHATQAVVGATYLTAYDLLSMANRSTQAVVGAAYLTARDSAAYLNTSAQALVGATYLTAQDIFNRAAHTSGVRAATELLYAGLAKAQEVADPDAAAKMASDAWSRWASYPPIASVLSLTEPVSSRSLEAFKSFHDGLVASSYYKDALDLTGKTLTYAKTTTPYKLGAAYVYPVLSPVADPAIDKVTKSKVINQTVEFWKPVVI